MASCVTREDLLDAYSFLTGSKADAGIEEAVEALLSEPVIFLQTRFTEGASTYLAFDGASPVLEPLNYLALIYVGKLVFRWTIEAGLELKILIDALKINTNLSIAKDRKARIDLILSIYARIRKVRGEGSEDTLRALLEKFLVHESLGKKIDQDTTSS